MSITFGKEHYILLGASEQFLPCGECKRKWSFLPETPENVKTKHCTEPETKRKLNSETPRERWEEPPNCRAQSRRECWWPQTRA